MTNPTTNVPAPTLGPTGFVAPLESAILAGVQADINAAFGGNLNFTTSSGGVTNPTPQGQLANSLTAIIANVQDLFLLYASLVDPALSSGRMQDALARIYFLSRIASVSTVVQATCIGLTNTVIAVGTLAQDTSGNIYAATQSGTIGVSGSITIPFANIVPGPTPCAAGALTVVGQSIPGWDAINNTSAGVTGTAVETASAFEQRRFASVANNAIGWIAALRAAVLGVPNVIDCYATENPTNAPATIGGVTLAANSIYVAVVGGLATDVAQAIWLHKAPGAAYNGNTTQTVYDTQSGYSPPYPSYAVTFQTPTNLPVIVSVTMANNGYVPANALALVQAAIVAAFSGQDVVGYTPAGQPVNGQRMRIGQTVFASRFYATLAGLWPNAQVVSILLGTPNAPTAAFTGSISGANMTVSSVTSGTIAVGQVIDDFTGLVLPGTTILSQFSGTTGGAGVYVLSATQVVAAETMYGINPALSEATVNINQYPAISANNVFLALI